LQQPVTTHFTPYFEEEIPTSAASATQRRKLRPFFAFEQNKLLRNEQMVHIFDCPASRQSGQCQQCT
jgi:hypothetical protein